jgi:SAM-dependent methyltransferase
MVIADQAAEPSTGYAFGYQPGVQNYLRLHTVERCGTVLLPYLRSGMSLLDAGCGPGTITVGLAPIVAPGQLVAVDLDPGEVERAAIALAPHPNATAQVASILDLPFADDSFDAVFSHAVIDYLTDPLAALRELRRVLKPGGVIGLRSVNNDNSVVGPPNALVEEGIALFRRAVASLGGDMTRGRLLGVMLKDAGFDEVFVRPSYERAQSREDWQSFCDAFAGCFDHSGISEICIGAGMADEQHMADIVAAFRKFGADTSNCFALGWAEGTARKPA